MAIFDATKKANNGKLSELEILQGQGLLNDDGDLVVFKGKIEVRLIGTFKVNSEGKIKGGHIGEIIVEKKGDEAYSIKDLDIKVLDFLDAVYDDQLQDYIPTMFKGKDEILGSNSRDKLYGFKGKDEINGYNGDDQIHGGKGNDKLWGDIGDDAFIFDTKLNAKKNVDTIKDWDLLKKQGGGTDSIWLDAGIFKAFAGMEGDGIAKKNFVVGKKPTSEDSHLIYNENKGRLYYDADGKGGDSKVLFAKFDDNPHLSHKDFLII